MSAKTNLRPLNVIEDLATALIRFDADTHAVLESVDREIQQTFAWLAEREQAWKTECDHRKVAVLQARLSLESCLASGTSTHRSACNREQRALAEAEAQLRQTEYELELVRHRRHDIALLTAAYQHDARQLALMLTSDRPRASAMIQRVVTVMYTYANQSADAMDTGGGSVPAAPSQADAAPLTTDSAAPFDAHPHT